MDKLGFARYPHQKCIFKWEDKQDLAVLLVYVDDAILACSSASKALNFIHKLNGNFEMKNMGSPKKFLGLEIVRNRADWKIFINQKLFIWEILDNFLETTVVTRQMCLSDRPLALSCTYRMVHVLT